MTEWIKRLQGYVKIRVWGFAPQRFINLCSNKGVLLWNIEKQDDIYTMCVSLKAFYQLRPIARKTKEVRNQIDLPQEYWNAFHLGMRQVVENKKYFSDLAVNVAGKTGTAEQTASRPNHALFICYAPYENPEIAIATRIPFGYSSDYAAQFTRDIIKYYYGLAEEDDLITGTADALDNAVSNEM